MSHTILLVEDDKAIRLGLTDFLESEGHQVIAAENGKQAIDILRNHLGACIVLLDLQMPVMTGEQFLEALKHEEDPKIKEVPILVLTARGEIFNHGGIVGVIRKPIDLDELLQKIRGYCP